MDPGVRQKINTKYLGQWALGKLRFSPEKIEKKIKQRERIELS
jgi:hypothetical protein